MCSKNKHKMRKNIFLKFCFTTQFYLIFSLCVLLVFCLFLFFYNFMIFLIVSPLAVLFSIYSIFILVNCKKEQGLLVERLVGEFITDSEYDFEKFPMPVLACLNDGIILWTNRCFNDTVNCGDDRYVGSSFLDMVKEPLDDFCSRRGVQVRLWDKDFKVHATYSDKSGIYVLYFEENSSLIHFAKEYTLSKPAVAYIKIDNYDEVLSEKKESEKSNIISKIDDVIENFVEKSTGFLQKTEDDEFLVVMEKRHLDNMINDKFSTLKNVSNISYDEKNSLTLSVGISSAGDTLNENKTYALQALDMALGRGGDQVAIKTATSFDFYGGRANDVEKRTRVKTRIVASALLELIEESDNVLIMGHRFGDLDSVGSGIGLGSAIRKCGKDSFFVVDSVKNMAHELIDKIKQSELSNLIIDVDSARSLISAKTLLIVVDTHNSALLESKEIYDSCIDVVVIDHHRKTVDFIDNAVIFYNEPYASSASELVCELIQYFGDDCKLGKIEAEAMLSGIMLDTKNFAIKVGARTFEAAAYLKRLGADTIAVKKLFSSTIESYKKKVDIVTKSEIYKKCAISVSNFRTPDVRIICPQAADELLNIKGVEASFVIYQIEDVVHVTARSLGGFNVQVIMERLGGGGHQSQAACQVKGSSIENTRQMLLKAIDEVFE